MIVASFYAYRYDQWGCDYHRLLRLLDASCRRLGLEHVCIGDAPIDGVDVLQCRLPDNLMMAILDGQRQCLGWASGPVLFVGADCLLTRDPVPVGAGDLTVTTGDFSDCEMNTGAIWCMSPDRCAPIWKAALDAKPTRWGEDQTALWAAMQAAWLRGRIDLVTVPADLHNRAPADEMDDAGMPTVVHFRGQRKRFMAAWAVRHLGLLG